MTTQSQPGVVQFTTPLRPRRPLIKAVKGMLAVAFLGGCRLSNNNLSFSNQDQPDASSDDSGSPFVTVGDAAGDGAVQATDGDASSDAPADADTDAGEAGGGDGREAG